MFKRSVFLLLLLTFKAFAQTITPNIGFEDGTFTNWECFIGSISSAGVISVFPTDPVPDRQTIFGPESANVLDRYGNFPVRCPNGSKYSARLGNPVPGGQAERLTYTFTVPPGGAYSIIFDYAVVLENPSHAPFQQPKFSAKVYNVSDDKYVECPSFDFAASSSLPGFKLSSAPGARGASIYYKDWSKATIHLNGYSGKTMRLEFTTNDCTLGGHFGYAYLDMEENSFSPVSGNAYCVGQRSISLYAPIGFAGYSWYNADLSKHLGDGPTLKISPSPPDKTVYAVVIAPYAGLGCLDTLYTTVNKIDEGFKLNIPAKVNGCPETGVDLTAPSITAGSSDGMTLSYFVDSLGTNYLYNPNKVMTSGVYYIQGLNKEGCMNILPIEVDLSPPPINVTDPVGVHYPATVDLSKTFEHLPDLRYSYYTNPEATVPLTNYTAINTTGKFYIKAVSNIGCVNVEPVNVTILPPPPYTITAPTAFTPNNDGVNDRFSVTITGILTFGSLKIFNRYGQLVFNTTTPGAYWDGMLNDQKLPVGTYYWVFEGTDGYYNKRVDRAASVTLLR